MPKLKNVKEKYSKKIRKEESTMIRNLELQNLILYLKAN